MNTPQRRTVYIREKERSSEKQYEVKATLSGIEVRARITFGDDVIISRIELIPNPERILVLPTNNSDNDNTGE